MDHALRFFEVDLLDDTAKGINRVSHDLLS